MLTYNEDKDLRRVKASVEIDKSQFRNCGGYKKAKYYSTIVTNVCRGQLAGPFNPPRHACMFRG